MRGRTAHRFAFPALIHSFICAGDAAEQESPTTFWMPKDQWDRYRNDTYKDKPGGELPFLPLEVWHCILAQLSRRQFP